MIASAFASPDGSSCQAPTPAMTKTAKIARIRTRTDRIAVLSLTSPTTAVALRHAHCRTFALTQSHDFHIWKSKWGAHSLLLDTFHAACPKRPFPASDLRVSVAEGDVTVRFC
ncbi:protein of unknown function [Streptomyces sp. KY75]|nr:protein of unknown function [Streptomyces sp. KY70]CAD5982819.1 protein of unknown function [Streptomyces sp. KY75]